MSRSSLFRTIFNNFKQNPQILAKNLTKTSSFLSNNQKTSKISQKLNFKYSVQQFLQSRCFFFYIFQFFLKNSFFNADSVFLNSKLGIINMPKSHPVYLGMYALILENLADEEKM